MLPYVLFLVMLATAWAAGTLARRYGFPLGLAVVALVVAGMLLRWPEAGPPGPPGPEGTRRGFEVLLFWVPMLGLSVISTAIGAYLRARAKTRSGE